MMQLIREKSRGIISWVIVGMIALGFCSWGVSSYFNNQSGPVVAKVDGQKITASEIDQLYEHWVHYNATNKAFDASQIDPKVIKQRLAVSLARERAIVRGLQKTGFAISDNYLIATIQSQPNLQIDGQFSIDLYKRFLQQNRIDENEFEDVQRDSLMLSQAQQGIVTSNFTLDKELEEIAKIRNQKRDLGYVIIPAANYQKEAVVTDAEIEDFYDKNGQFMKEPQKVKLQYIELSIDHLIKDKKIDEQMLREYYQNNMQLFSEPEVVHVRHIMVEVPINASAKQKETAKNKIDAVYKKLKDGTNFETLAREESEDKITASKGGDLGWIGKGDQALPASVYALNKNGEFTEPVQSDYGWHIFEVYERKGGEAKDYNSVKNVVAARYKQDMAERLFKETGEELTNLSYENPNTLQPASDKLNLPIQTTDYFTEQAGTGIASSKNVRSAAFSDEVLGQQRNSDLIRVSDDSFVVIRVADMQPERQKTLAEVKDDIRTMLQKQAAAVKAKQLGENLVQEIKSGTAADKAASKLRLEWKTQKNAARDNKATPTPILQNAFMIEKPTAEAPLSVAGFQLPNGNFAVVTVSKVIPGTFDEKVEQISTQALKQQIATIQGRLEYESFQAALIAKANIKFYEAQK
jgi:peptidyl-prolyl cis-trans isomerase D